MPFKVIAEAAARIEHKLDLIIKGLGKAVPVRGMQFVGNDCPVCLHQVSYKIDQIANVVSRQCKCGTGKIPSITLVNEVIKNERSPIDGSKVEVTDVSDSGKGSILGSSKLRG